MMTTDTRSLSPGRRERDEDCLQHERELEEVKLINSKNSGRFTAMLWFMGIIGTGMCIGITVAITMLSNIQSTMNSAQVSMMQHAEQIRALRDVEIPNIKASIKDIDDRHRWEDQHRK